MTRHLPSAPVVRALPDLLAENGWTARAHTWAREDGRRLVIDAAPNAIDLKLWWALPAPREKRYERSRTHRVDDLTEAVDVLCALRVLPADLSSMWRDGAKRVNDGPVCEGRTDDAPERPDWMDEAMRAESHLAIARDLSDGVAPHAYEVLNLLSIACFKVVLERGISQEFGPDRDDAVGAFPITGDEIADAYAAELAVGVRDNAGKNAEAGDGWAVGGRTT